MPHPAPLALPVLLLLLLLLVLVLLLLELACPDAAADEQVEEAAAPRSCPTLFPVAASRTSRPTAGSAGPVLMRGCETATAQLHARELYVCTSPIGRTSRMKATPRMHSHTLRGAPKRQARKNATTMAVRPQAPRTWPRRCRRFKPHRHESPAYTSA